METQKIMMILQVINAILREVWSLVFKEVE